jgi:hypothetical protein
MTLSDKQIYLYVGPHKSGTFYLRDQIFPHVKGIYDVRTHSPHLIDRILDATAENPLFYDASTLKEELERCLGNVKENKIVISSPDFFGAYMQMESSAVFKTKQFWDNQHKTELLADLFPHARIILTPRRQDTWIESYYRGVLKSALTVELSTFVSPYSSPENSGTPRSEEPACDLATLDWAIYIRNYFKLFGKTNVLVIPNEKLLLDTSEALAKLYTFMDVPSYTPQQFIRVNRGYSARACKIARALNRFVHTKRNPLGFIPNRPFYLAILARRDRSLFWRILAGISRRLSLNWFLVNIMDRYFRGVDALFTTEERDRILKYFAAANREYAEMIDEDLDRYGYY